MSAVRSGERRRSPQGATWLELSESVFKTMGQAPVCKLNNLCAKSGVRLLWPMLLLHACSMATDAESAGQPSISLKSPVFMARPETFLGVEPRTTFSHRGCSVQCLALCCARDKNHPCIIMWSLGNESGYGPAHDAMAAYLRTQDPTRPIHYEVDKAGGEGPCSFPERFLRFCGTHSRVRPFSKG